jgi:hypothetical protein
MEVFRRLRGSLELDVRASGANYGVLLDKLDQAERNAQEAVELLVNAQLAAEVLEIDVSALRAPMRQGARERLQQERKTGDKPITEGDVSAAIISLYPDEVRDLAVREAKAKGMTESIRSLAERWKERARDLRVMVQTARGAVG